MFEKDGIIHIYLQKKTAHIVADEPFDSIGGKAKGAYGLRAGNITLLGDEEGFYRLWMAVGEAMVSRAGRGRARVRLADGTPYEVDLVRVEGRANFLKEFKPDGIV